MIEKETHPFIDGLTGREHRWSGRTNFDDDRHPECCYARCDRPATTVGGPRDWPPDWDSPDGVWFRDVCRRHEIELKIGWYLSIPLTPVILLYFLLSYAWQRLTAEMKTGEAE